MFHTDFGPKKCTGSAYQNRYCGGRALAAFRTFARIHALTIMNIATGRATRRLFILLFPLTPLSGCAVAPPEPSQHQMQRDSYPDDKKKTDEAPRPSAEPSIDADPATRRRKVPSPIDRPVPARPPPQSVVRPQIQALPTEQSVKPSSPSPVHVCDPGGCFGASGNRYQGGIGDIYLDSNGKPCQRSGSWMQCN